MKKITKTLLISILVLSLVLSLFTGCDLFGGGGKPTPTPGDTGKPIDTSFQQKYGIDFQSQSITYDGEDHKFEIVVDEDTLGSNSYEVYYAYQDKSSYDPYKFKNAGSYTVKAIVTVNKGAANEATKTFDSTYTIEKVNLEVSIGDQFLCKGHGASSIGSISNVFKDCKFVGSDTKSVLGTLSYIVSGDKGTINDVPSLPVSTKVSDSYKLTLKTTKEPINYNITINSGKLYVLSSEDYNVAEDLKEAIDSVPTQAEMDKYDYYKMRDFVNYADDIVKKYPSTSEIQRLMCGQANITTVKALSKIANKRVHTIYDLDSDVSSSDGEVEFVAVNHNENDMRDDDHDYYESDFEPDRSSAKTEVEYNDEFAFVVTAKDETISKFMGCNINGKFYDVASFTREDSGDNVHDNKEVKYRFGTLRTATQVEEVNNTFIIKGSSDTSALNKWMGDAGPRYGWPEAAGTDTGLKNPSTDPVPANGNPGVNSNGVNVSALFLGELNGFSTIYVNPVFSEVYNARLYAGSTLVTNENELAERMPALDSFKVQRGTETTILADDTGSDSILDSCKDMFLTKEYKIYLEVNEGYTLESLEIGDEIVKVKDMEAHGSGFTYEFVLEEDHTSGSSSNKVVKFVPNFVKQYSFTAKINNSVRSNKEKNGHFVNDEGEITLVGVAEGRTPTLLEDKTLEIQLKSAKYYLVSKFEIYQNYTEDGSPVENKENLIKDVSLQNNSGVISGAIRIDLESSKFRRFSSEHPITVEVIYTEYYPIEVTGKCEGSADVEMTKSGGEFQSKFGSVAICNTDGDEITEIAEGQNYYIRLENEDGYVLRDLKVGKLKVVAYDKNTKTVTEGLITEYERYQQQDQSPVYVYNGSGDANKLNAKTSLTSESRDDIYLLVNSAGLDPGETLKIEVTYDAYYTFDVTGSYADFDTTVNFCGGVNGNTVVFDTASLTDPQYTDSVKGLLESGAGLIRIDADSYYAYHSDDRIEVLVTLKPEYRDGVGTDKEVDEVTIECGAQTETDDRTTNSLRCDVDEAAKDSDPGDSINIDIRAYANNKD